MASSFPFGTAAKAYFQFLNRDQPSSSARQRLILTGGTTKNPGQDRMSQLLTACSGSRLFGRVELVIRGRDGQRLLNCLRDPDEERRQHPHGNALKDDVLKEICRQPEFPAVLEEALQKACQHEVLVITCAAGKHRSVALGRKVVETLQGLDEKHFHSIMLVHTALLPLSAFLILKALLAELK